MSGQITRIPPSAPGYNLTSADVGALNVSPEQAARVMLAVAQGLPANVPGLGAIAPGDVSGVTLLLAAILRSQKRASASYTPFGFGFATWARQQVFGPNPNRAYLLIQNVGSGDLMVCFENGPQSVQDLSAATDQQQLTNQQQRSVRIVAGGYFEPLVPPTNPITLFTLGTGTQGLAVEGA